MSLIIIHEVIAQVIHVAVYTCMYIYVPLSTWHYESLMRCIAVTIRCPEVPERKELNKKLPSTMTVQKLKGLLQRLYKVPYSEQKLSYQDSRVSVNGVLLCGTYHGQHWSGWPPHEWKWMHLRCTCLGIVFIHTCISIAIHCRSLFIWYSEKD